MDLPQNITIDEKEANNRDDYRFGIKLKQNGIEISNTVISKQNSLWMVCEKLR